jgi:DNA-binding Lrp family transcriptional regulator
MDRVELEGKTVAYVLIKAEKGAANDVASAVAEFDGVYWTSVITGPYDVIAAVYVDDNARLGELVIKAIQQVPGVSNPSTQVATAFYIGPQGRSWFP